MAKSREESIRYITEWQKEHVRRYSLRLNRDTEADMIQHLESVGRVQTYLKRLIRADMKKGSDLL